MFAVRFGLESTFQNGRRLNRMVHAVCSYLSEATEAMCKKKRKRESQRQMKGQTIVGSAYRHTNDTVSCHHIVKHNVLLEKKTENR